MALMQQNRLMPADISGLLLAATFCSMLLTPLLLRAAPRVAAHLHRKPNEEAQLDQISALNAGLSGHVVICGYGRVGQSIGRFLRREGQAFVALDDDPVIIQEANGGDPGTRRQECQQYVAIDNSHAPGQRQRQQEGQHYRHPASPWGWHLVGAALVGYVHEAATQCVTANRRRQEQRDHEDAKQQGKRLHPWPCSRYQRAVSRRASSTLTGGVHPSRRSVLSMSN
ncbi:hypothetical protein FQZ97_984770 [compost metagenome]